MYTLIFANPMLFLSTLSLRRATPVRDVIQWEGIFLSTLSLRRATASDSLSDTSDVISIHALLAESDASKRAQQPKQPNFYPRSPCGERRLIRSLSIMLFDFYPRSPCGERPADLRRSSLQNRISIHALLAESDECRSMSADGFARISIHALLAESDFIFSSPVSISKKFLSTLSLRRATGRFGTTRIRRHFYPRSPCGERPQGSADAAAKSAISIHALLAESDGRPQCAGRQDGNFYPRSPCGERRVLAATLPENRHFYPRSPCGERRLDVTIIGRTWDISIHALLAESDTIRL